MIDLRESAPADPFDEPLPYLPPLREALKLWGEHARKTTRKPQVLSFISIVEFPDGSRGTVAINYLPPVD